MMEAVCFLKEDVYVRWVERKITTPIYMEERVMFDSVRNG